MDRRTPDPDVDLQEPTELVDEACQHLFTALAALDDIRKVLRGESPPPRQGRLNVVVLSARPTCRIRDRNDRKSSKRPRRRGPYPRKVE